MKRSIFLTSVIFSLLFASILFLTGCSKDNDSLSKTDLLCRTWIWGDENDLNWETYMTFHVDGTAVLEDINLSTNHAAYFQYTWKWGNSEETLLVLTSNKSGQVDYLTIDSITEKELITKDQSGNKGVIKAK